MIKEKHNTTCKTAPKVLSKSLNLNLIKPLDLAANLQQMLKIKYMLSYVIIMQSAKYRPWEMCKEKKKMEGETYKLTHIKGGG